MVRFLEEKSNGEEPVPENTGTLRLKSKVSEDLTNLGPIVGMPVKNLSSL